jgi:hypothetical protein
VLGHDEHRPLAGVADSPRRRRDAVVGHPFRGAQGLEVAPSTPEQFAAHIKSEIARFGKIAKAAGIKAE